MAGGRFDASLIKAWTQSISNCEARIVGQKSSKKIPQELKDDYQYHIKLLVSQFRKISHVLFTKADPKYSNASGNFVRMIVYDILQQSNLDLHYAAVERWLFICKQAYQEGDFFTAQSIINALSKFNHKLLALFPEITVLQHYFEMPENIAIRQQKMAALGLETIPLLQMLSRAADSSSVQAKRIIGHYDLTFVEFETNLYAVPNEERVTQAEEAQKELFGLTGKLPAFSVIEACGLHDSVSKLFAFIPQISELIKMFDESKPKHVMQCQLLKAMVVALNDVRLTNQEMLADIHFSYDVCEFQLNKTFQANMDERIKKLYADLKVCLLETIVEKPVMSTAQFYRRIYLNELPVAESAAPLPSATPAPAPKPEEKKQKKVAKSRSQTFQDLKKSKGFFDKLKLASVPLSPRPASPRYLKDSKKAQYKSSPALFVHPKKIADKSSTRRQERLIKK